MKRVFYIKDSIENKISYYHLLLFMLLLPFDRIYSTLVLISFLLHSLIFLQQTQLKRIDRSVLILQSIFLAGLVSLLYAIYPLRALDVAGKQLAIFLFPLLLAVTRLNLRKYFNNLLFGFSLGCSLTVLYLYFDAFHIIAYNRLPLQSIFSAAFVNHNFSLSIDMHATYLSMLLVIAITWLLRQLIAEPAGKPRLMYIICITILVAGLIQLASKSALIAFFIIIMAGFPYLVLSGKKKLRFILVSLLVFAVVLATILSVDVFRNRYITLLKTDLHENTEIADKSGRLDRWTAAFDLIKNHPFFGTGSGSEIPLLKDVYFQRKMYAAWLNSLNVHNQYLGVLINTGFTGLLVYLFTLAWGLWRAIRKQDIMLFAFIVLTAVVSLAEDMLDVNKGIFFYAFFFSLLVFSKRTVITKYIIQESQPGGEQKEYMV